MAQVTFDFSREGWRDAAKEFGLSILKTGLAAAVLAVIAQLDAYQIPTELKFAGELAIGLGLARAFLTSFWVWLTKTSASVVPVEQATETVVEETVAPAQG
jgi:hypothetical protein